MTGNKSITDANYSKLLSAVRKALNKTLKKTDYTLEFTDRTPHQHYSAGNPCDKKSPPETEGLKN